MNKTKISKLLSFALRHKPEELNLTLDKSGWANINDLLKSLKYKGHNLSRDDLNEIVETNNKKRFAISEDGKKIRASQGHSIKIDLGYTPTSPPSALYHGTVSEFLDSIFKKGLIKGSRHHVHLSKDIETAINVGSRRGKPIILEIDSKSMEEDGYDFFVSENGVWLTEHVPPKYITIK